MFFTIYQHSWHFNLETLLMLGIFIGIFGKIPPSWKLLSTIYQFNWWVDLISDCHYLILKLKNSSCNIVANHISMKSFWLKKGGFLLVHGYSLLFKPFKKFERNMNFDSFEFASNAFGILNLLSTHHIQSIN
jgi:hypothetical protein